jgi:hypothetical protein
VIVACRWPKACDYAGEGFDDVRGSIAETRLPVARINDAIIEGINITTTYWEYHILMNDVLACDAVF